MNIRHQGDGYYTPNFFTFITDKQIMLPLSNKSVGYHARMSENRLPRPFRHVSPTPRRINLIFRSVEHMLLCSKDKSTELTEHGRSKDEK